MSNQQKATQLVFHKSCTQGQEELQGWSSQTEVANKQNWQTQCSLKQNKLSRCQEKLLVQTLETIATCSFFQNQLSSARARTYHLAAPTPANVFQGHFAQYLSLVGPKSFDNYQTFKVWYLCTCWEMILAEPECCWGLFLSTYSPPELESSLLTSPRLANKHALRSLAHIAWSGLLLSFLGGSSDAGASSGTSCRSRHWSKNKATSG